MRLVSSRKKAASRCFCALRCFTAVIAISMALGASGASAERSGRVILLVRGDRAEEVETAANAAVRGQGLDVVERDRVAAQIAAQGLPSTGLPTENQMRGLALMFDARAVLVIQTGATPDGRAVATLQVVSPERADVAVHTIDAAPEQLTVQVAVAVSQLDLSLPEPPAAAVEVAAAPISPAAIPAPPSTHPPMYTPSVASQVAPAPAEPESAEHTGSTVAIYFPYSPIGNTELRDAGTLPSIFASDWVQQVGLGGYLAGLGRKVGGGIGIRAVWLLHGDDLSSDESNKAIDIYGLLRIHHRHGFWEAYANLEFGHSVQVAKLAYLDPSASPERNRGWGFNFAFLPGIRFDVGPDTGIFLQGGFLYRFIHFDRSADFDLNTVQRMFILQTGLTFGA